MEGGGGKGYSFFSLPWSFAHLHRTPVETEHRANGKGGGRALYVIAPVSLAAATVAV